MKCIIAIVLFLSMHSKLNAQLQLSNRSPGSLVHKHTGEGRPVNIRLSPLVTFQNNKQIPDNYYAQHLGFFCKQELKMQQVHVPLTFRVGTMDQCNYLEQKPGYKIY